MSSIWFYYKIKNINLGMFFTPFIFFILFVLNVK